MDLRSNGFGRIGLHVVGPAVKVCYDTDATLVTVLPPTIEEVKVEEAAVVAEGAAVEGAPAAEGAKGEPEKKG